MCMYLSMLMHAHIYTWKLGPGLVLRRVLQWNELRLRLQLGMRKAKMVFQSKVHDHLWVNCHAQVVMDSWEWSWTFSYLHLKWAWDPHRDSSFNFDLYRLFQSKPLPQMSIFRIELDAFGFDPQISQKISLMAVVMKWDLKKGLWSFLII